MQNSKTPVVLVVDDEPGLRAVLEIEFRHAGFGVRTASSGRDAVQILESSPVDAVVADLCMPQGGGRDLIDHIRSRHATRPAILIITGDDEVDEAALYRSGVDGVLVKPFDTRVLVSRLRQVLLVSDGGIL